MFLSWSYLVFCMFLWWQVSEAAERLTFESTHEQNQDTEFRWGGFNERKNEGSTEVSEDKKNERKLIADSLSYRLKIR